MDRNISMEITKNFIYISEENSSGCKYSTQAYTPEKAMCEYLSSDMSDNIVKKAIRELLTESVDEKFEALYEVLQNEMETDDEPFDKKGYHLCKDLIADDALISICGWSLESLLKKAGLMHDYDAEFYPEPIDAKIIAVTINDIEYIADCLVNMQTFEVYNIKHELDQLSEDEPEIKCEYIEINEHRFPVYPYDEGKDSITRFWYGENE